MSDTPRTDANLCLAPRVSPPAVMWLHGYGNLVKADFARELELELAKEKEKVEDLKYALENCPSIGYKEGVKLQSMYDKKLGGAHGLPFIHNDVRAAIQSYVDKVINKE